MTDDLPIRYRKYDIRMLWDDGIDASIEREVTSKILIKKK
jgi:hypothetical protein